MDEPDDEPEKEAEKLAPARTPQKGAKQPPCTGALDDRPGYNCRKAGAVKHKPESLSQLVNPEPGPMDEPDVNPLAEAKKVAPAKAPQKGPKQPTCTGALDERPGYNCRKPGVKSQGYKAPQKLTSLAQGVQWTENNQNLPPERVSILEPVIGRSQTTFYSQQPSYLQLSEDPAPATSSAKDMEKKLDSESAKPEEAPKTKAELKKEAIARGENVASNAEPPSDIKGDKIMKSNDAIAEDNRASLPVCNARNGHPGVDCRPLPVCQGAREDVIGENCRNPGPPSSQPPSRSIGNPGGMPEQPLNVPTENVDNKDGAGVLSVDPKVVEASKDEAKAAANKTTAEPAKKAETTATASF